MIWDLGFANPESDPNPESQIPNHFGIGVCIVAGSVAPHFFSVAVRMSRTDAPPAYICIASRAMSMHTAHVMPWASHAVTSPFASR